MSRLDIPMKTSRELRPLQWRWEVTGSDVAVMALGERGQRALLTLELHFMDETVCGFWLDGDGAPFAMLRRHLPV